MWGASYTHNANLFMTGSPYKSCSLQWQEGVSHLETVLLAMQTWNAVLGCQHWDGSLPAKWAFFKKCHSSSHPTSYTTWIDRSCFYYLLNPDHTKVENVRNLGGMWDLSPANAISGRDWDLERWHSKPWHYPRPSVIFKTNPRLMRLTWRLHEVDTNGVRSSTTEEHTSESGTEASQAITKVPAWVGVNDINDLPQEERGRHGDNTGHGKKPNGSWKTGATLRTHSTAQGRAGVEHKGPQITNTNLGLAFLLSHLPAWLKEGPDGFRSRARSMHGCEGMCVPNQQEDVMLCAFLPR